MGLYVVLISLSTLKRENQIQPSVRVLKIKALEAIVQHQATSETQRAARTQQNGKTDSSYQSKLSKKQAIAPLVVMQHHLDDFN